MNRNSIRLLFSFAFSIFCAIATHVWYKSAKPLTVDYQNRKPIARLAESVNEVQRKPLKRLIWQTLSLDDNLYGGEQIRTTANSEARIEILKTGATISLEPESLIVLDDSNGELALDFLAGNLFVKAGESGGALNVTSGGKTLNLAGAELALGKNKSGSMDVQVIKGSINGLEAAADPFEPLGPPPHGEIYVKPDGKDVVTWEWKKNFPEGSKIVLEVGKNRTGLKPKADATLKGNKLQTVLPPGDYYWKLVSSDADGKTNLVESKVYKIRVIAKRPPVLLMPEEQQDVVLEDIAQKVDFQWANVGKLEQLQFEIAESADFKKNLKSLPITENDKLQLALPKAGTFFWRVTGYLAKTKEPLSSKLQSFRASVAEKLGAPVPLLPEAQHRYRPYLEEVKSVDFKWKPSAGALHYRFTLKKKSGDKSEVVREEKLNSPEFTIADLPSANYEWSVVALGNENKESKPSESRTFSMESMPVIPWKSAQQQTFDYWTSDPQLDLGWNDGPGGTAKYRVTFKKEGEENTAPSIFLSGKPEVKSTLPSSGRWIASVEALNEKEQVIGKSEERPLELKPVPLLSGPVFEASVPNPLTSNRRGGLAVSWKQLEGAKNYVVEIQDEKGKVVQTQTTAQPQASFAKLQPGQFRIRVRATDAAGRAGQFSESRPLVVPETSDVRSPKLMKVKVQ